MRFLSNSEIQKLDQIADNIVSGPKNQDARKSALFYPQMVEEQGALSPDEWLDLPKSSKKMFIFLMICADLHCKHGGYEKAINKRPIQMNGVLGRAIWTSNLATANGTFASKYGWAVLNTYTGPSDPQLSKDIYIFQHYAEFSQMGEKNPSIADPNVKMEDAISGSSNAGGYNRDGILGPRTMNMLESMVNSGFTKVSSSAVDIAPAGAGMARKLVDALSWPALNMAKDRPSESAVPAAPQNIPCSDIAKSILEQPGIENNPAYAHCFTGSGQQASGGGSAAKQIPTSWLTPVIKTALKQPLPGFPGFKFTPNAVVNLREKLPKLTPLKPAPFDPNAPDNDKPLPFPEAEPEQEEIAQAESDSSDDSSSKIPVDTTTTRKTESATQTDTVKTSSGLFTDENGKLTPLAIGLGLAGMAGLAWLLLSPGSNQIEYNQFGQPLQTYDDNGMPIIQTNKNGQPLQCYDMQGRPVSLTNRFGQPLQTYTEDGLAVSRKNDDGSAMTLFDLEGNIVYVNQVANVSVNTSMIPMNANYANRR